VSDPGTDDPLTSTVVLPETAAVVADGPAEQRAQVGSVLRDRFLLQERLTGGGMGVVFKALDRRLAESGDPKPWVAIKVLSPQFAANGHALRALQQEAAKGRYLTHPNIVRFLDFDRDDDLYFIVMEWLEGRTLADILDSPDAGTVDAERAFRIVRQVGSALEYAHRCGIVHADVKPANVMILPNGDARLFDFGVARVRQKALEQQPDFDPGVLGLMTPAYSSMQVLTGETPVPADDVFSLACLLYRLLAGYRVFGPRNAAEAAQEGMEPQRLSNVSDSHWRALKKALSYARVTRFGSMAEFLAALEDTVSEPIRISVPARPGSEPRQQSSSRLRWLVLAAALAGIAGVAEWQFKVIGQVRERLAAEVVPEPRLEPVAEETPPVTEEFVAVDLPEDADPANEAPVEPDNVEEPAVELPGAVEVVDLDAELAVEMPAEFATRLVDYSTLPPPTAELRLATPGGTVRTTAVRLREDGNPVTIDLVRADTRFPLTLKVEEISFSGNRSPWSSGQYTFSDNDFVEFPVGQDRARLSLVMTSDPVREADQQSSLRVREADSSDSELGIINITLEDDDQRRFEATLPANTIGFATSQVAVREQDPAVQIDVLRFNPDNTSLVVGYTIRDITATQGEDYFAPSRYSIEFGPGQRSARLLIPLVQDTEYEDNEAFSVELSDTETPAGLDVYFRTAVMIRDDDN
jgi:serine/threonine protein kinase